MSLKVAIVGCGKIADGHVEEIQKMPATARVVAVCDLELLMAEQLAVRYGISNHYDNLDKMLEAERPDVVHITTPPQSHLMLATKVLDAGCHVYVEKPLTLNLADSQKLITHAEEQKRKVTIGYSYYFAPPAEALRTMIRNGVIGDPVHMESFFGYNLSGAFGTALLSDTNHWVQRLPGKLFHNNIDHLLYKATEFFADETPVVRALGYARRPERFNDARDNMLDELRVMLHCKNATLSGTFSSHIRPVANFIRLYGTKNTVMVDYVAQTVTLDEAPKLPSAIGRLLPPFGQAMQYFKQGSSNMWRFVRSDFHYFAGLNRLISLFYESIRNDSPPPISYRHILWVAGVMDEIFRQVPQEGQA
jgi:predicted dehydrogenase